MIRCFDRGKNYPATEHRNYNSIWNSFNRSINTMCAFAFVFTFIVFSFVLFLSYVYIKLHKSTHCRISMFQTWSLCFCLARFQVNVNETKVIWDWDQFLYQHISMRKSFSEKFMFCRDKFGFNRFFNFIDSINVLFSFFYLNTFPANELTDSFIRATFYFLHRRTSIQGPII